MEAAAFMVIPALPVEEFSTQACTTGFITRGFTMVFIIPEVFCGSSAQDLTMGALIRRFICGDFPKGFLAIAFAPDSITTGFTRDSVTTDFTMVFITENSPAGAITDFTANRLSSRTDRSHPQRSCHWIWLPMLSKSLRFIRRTSGSWLRNPGESRLSTRFLMSYTPKCHFA
jgi:hypothetical protein